MINWVKAWISRDALTRGIYEREVMPAEGGFFNGCAMAGARYGSPTEYFDPGDWHLTREGAVLAATELRRRKIAMLEQQIATLKKAIELDANHP